MATVEMRFLAVREPLDAERILAGLPHPVLEVGSDDSILYANPASEQLFSASATQLQRMSLSQLVPFGSPVLALVAQVRTEGSTMSEHEVDVGTPRIGTRIVNATVAPLGEGPDTVLISLQETGIASKMDRQLMHRGAARMVAGMAAVLAHEIKNPLSGIRGAAQLLEQDTDESGHVLTRLICDETDRICALVDRMEVFSDKPIERAPVNIHRVLERVRMVAQSGFASGIQFEENYDPSLPAIHGNFDQLVQAFLNLVRNAAQAVPAQGGIITLGTAFRHGVRLAVPGSQTRMRLPLEVTVQDNGAGVPEDLMPHLFDPFVSTKIDGAGLGLALVAKIVRDHGGVVECESRPRRTVFRIMLPLMERSE